MIINPCIINKENGKLYFDKKVEVSVCDKLDANYIKELFENFTFGKISFEVKPSKEFLLSVNNEFPVDFSGYEYGISVKNGISVCAKDSVSLLHGIYSLLDMIEYDENGLYIQKCQIVDKPKLNDRIIHVCVFPETSLDFILRTVKVCGFLKYSQIILEFWGMLKYECNRYLGWKNAFGKEDAHLIEQTAEKAGITVVPMFNCLGHAAQSRLCSGKHVMLDQSPECYEYFEPDGWVWNIENPATKELIKNIIHELCLIFPKSKYFHIGCDEAYSYTASKEKAKKLVEYINSIADELSSLNRTALMWGDMLFYRHEFSGDGNNYEFNIKEKEIAEIIRKGLNKKIIICDWQYNAENAPFLSSKRLTDEGFKVLCCPFLEFANVKASVKTAEMLGLDGVICTTWHLLNEKYPYILESAKECWEGVKEDGNREARNIYENSYTKCASLVRKLDFSCGEYEKCGWLKKQI